jgi:SAM-dependent methyltransferase
MIIQSPAILERDMINPICGCESDPILDRRVISQPWSTVFECKGCGLWYVDRLLKPCAGEDLLHRHMSEHYVSAFAPGYLDSLPSRAETSLFSNATSSIRTLYPDASCLLDVGCGTGRFLQFMKQSGDWRVLLGLEVSPFLAQRARAKGLDIVMGDVQSVCFQDGSFDVVAMWDVVEHLARPLDALKQIHRILSPGGILILLTPNAGGILHSLALWMHRLGIGLLQKPAKRVFFGGHPLYFTSSSLRQLLARSGFATRVGWQHSVASEMSFRGGLIEDAAKMIDASLVRL